MNTPRLLTVLDRREENASTVTLQLGAGDEQPLPAFMPGQFNMLYTFGRGEVPISFSGSPLNGDGYFHTLRAVGKKTDALAHLQPGDSVGVRGPFGRGWPMAQLEGKHIVIVAGGLGLAPLQPVIETLLQQRQRVASVQLFYGGRQPSELLYQHRYSDWSQAMDIELCVDRGDANWSGHIGVVTQLLANAPLPVQNAIALVCGPEIMMRFTLQALQKRHFDDTAIWLSMERNMHCATGHCGHCQWGPRFVCKDGPVFCLAEVSDWFNRREV